jgi:hypothetical protein
MAKKFGYDWHDVAFCVLIIGLFSIMASIMVGSYLAIPKPIITEVTGVFQNVEINDYKITIQFENCSIVALDYTSKPLILIPGETYTAIIEDGKLISIRLEVE